MDCTAFQYWLKTRDVKAPMPPGARTHMASCSSCAAMLAQDQELEHQLLQTFHPAALPRGLENRIDVNLDNSGPFPGKLTLPPQRLLVYGGFLAGLVALFLIFHPMFARSRLTDLNQISLRAVAGHLKGNRHMTFDSTQLDQALDMLTRELGFKVILPDLTSRGWVILGGRLCAVGKCRAAYFIVQKDGKTGSLFIMDSDHLRFEMADSTRFHTHVKGCDTQIWKNSGQVYAMVF